MQAPGCINMIAIGNNIAQLRKAIGCSQEDFADRVGLSRKAMGSIERGESAPRLDTLFMICAELHTTPNDLLSADLLKRMDTDPEMLQMAERAQKLSPPLKKEFYRMMDVCLKGLSCEEGRE